MDVKLSIAKINFYLFSNETTMEISTLCATTEF